MSSPSYNFAALSAYMKGLNIHLTGIRKTQEKLQRQMDAMLAWQEAENDPEYDEESSEWEDVYAESYWTLGKDTAQYGKLYEGVYYQTYGGGPSGGYVVRDNKYYAVHYTWSDGWSVKELQGRLKFIKTDDGIKHVIHIMPKPTVSKESIEAADSSS